MSKNYGRIESSAPTGLQNYMNLCDIGADGGDVDSDVDADADVDADGVDRVDRVDTFIAFEVFKYTGLDGEGEILVFDFGDSEQLYEVIQKLTTLHPEIMFRLEVKPYVHIINPEEYYIWDYTGSPVLGPIIGTDQRLTESYILEHFTLSA